MVLYVINSRLHDSYALAVVFFSDESQRVICQLSSIYEKRCIENLNVHRKIKLRLEMKLISLDPE